MKKSAKDWYPSVSIIPVEARGKKPLVVWKEYTERLPTPDERRAWRRKFPGSNYGLVCGSVSGVVAIDFDGPEGKALFDKYEVKGATSVNVTPNGYHALYMIPDEPLPNFTGIVPGIDFRGECGYIIIPPSVHPSGASYVWQWPPWEVRPLPDLPSWFLALLKLKQQRDIDLASTVNHMKANVKTAETFGDFAKSHGCIVPPGGWIADGNIHRCDALGPSGKVGVKDGSYLLHLDEPVCGYVQNHHLHTKLMDQVWRPIT